MKIRQRSPVGRAPPPPMMDLHSGTTHLGQGGAGPEAARLLDQDEPRRRRGGALLPQSLFRTAKTTDERRPPTNDEQQCPVCFMSAINMLRIASLTLSSRGLFPAVVIQRQTFGHRRAQTAPKNAPRFVRGDPPHGRADGKRVAAANKNDCLPTMPTRRSHWTKSGTCPPRCWAGLRHPSHLAMSSRANAYGPSSSTPVHPWEPGRATQGASHLKRRRHRFWRDHALTALPAMSCEATTPAEDLQRRVRPTIPQNTFVYTFVLLKLGN